MAHQHSIYAYEYIGNEIHHYVSWFSRFISCHGLDRWAVAQRLQNVGFKKELRKNRGGKLIR